MRKTCSALLVLLAVLPAFSQTSAPKPLDLLKEKIETIAHSVSADWGIYVKSLDTGEELGINADSVMDTMSVIKIPLLVDVYRQIDAGKIDPGERIVMKTADKPLGPACCAPLNRG